MKILFLILSLISCISCAQNTELTYHDYFYNLNHIGESKVKVYQAIGKDSLGYSFISLDYILRDDDTLIIQKSFDTKKKYDSTILKISQQNLKILESYFFTPDSIQKVEKVQFLKGQTRSNIIPKNYNQTTKVSVGHNDNLIYDVKEERLGLKKIMIDDKLVECLVICSKNKMYLNDELFTSSVDTTYSRKNRAVVKYYFGFPDEEKILKLVKVVEKSNFNISDYK